MQTYRKHSGDGFENLPHGCVPTARQQKDGYGCLPDHKGLPGRFRNSEGSRAWGYLSGPAQRAAGKTRIAAGIANELMKSYAVKFAVSLTILQEIKNTWRRDAEYSESPVTGCA